MEPQAEYRERRTVTLYPRQLDRLAYGDVVDGAIDDRGREAERALFVELDSGDRMRSGAVVDTRCGRTLVQQHQEMDRAPSTDLGGVHIR